MADRRVLSNARPEQMHLRGFPRERANLDGAGQQLRHRRRTE
jgi:hypothetical protein